MTTISEQLVTNEASKKNITLELIALVLSGDARAGGKSSP
jgi:hypothetical protein